MVAHVALAMANQQDDLKEEETLPGTNQTSSGRGYPHFPLGEKGKKKRRKKNLASVSHDGRCSCSLLVECRARRRLVGARLTVSFNCPVGQDGECENAVCAVVKVATYCSKGGKSSSSVYTRERHILNPTGKSRLAGLLQLASQRGRLLPSRVFGCSPTLQILQMKTLATLGNTGKTCHFVNIPFNSGIC